MHIHHTIRMGQQQEGDCIRRHRLHHTHRNMPVFRQDWRKARNLNCSFSATAATRQTNRSCEEPGNENIVVFFVMEFERLIIGVTSRGVVFRLDR